MEKVKPQPKIDELNDASEDSADDVAEESDENLEHVSKEE